MYRKITAVILALFAVCCCVLPAAAQAMIGVISVRLNSDIAGLTKDDAEKLIELRSDNVEYSTMNGGPVMIANYAGTIEDGAVSAGRTYYIYYTLVAADGYTLPETLKAEDIDIECGRGVSVISTQIVKVSAKDENGITYPFTGLRIYAKVVVDGSVFQRIVGCFYDIMLKIRAWSLY